MIRRWFALIALLSGMFWLPTAVADAPDPEKKAVLQSLLQHLNVSQQLKESRKTAVRQTLDQYVQSMRTQVILAGYTDEQRAKVNAAMADFPAQIQPVIEQFVADAMPEDLVRQRLVQVYSDNFTLDELKELDRFYSTPAGQKEYRLTPQLASDMMAGFKERIQKLVPNYSHTINEKSRQFLHTACGCNIP